MRNNFRQGIISYTKDGTGAPQFLLPSQTNGYVRLNVEPTPTVVTFAHGDSNYLATFDTSLPNAWGPLVANVDNYLYWDMDLLTSNVTQGITTLEPVVSTFQPASPVNGQMWFDLIAMKMKLWQNASNKWIEKVRVIAGVVPNGNVSQLAAKGIGSQIGVDAINSMHGFVMLDSQLRPLRTSTGEFLTSETPIRVRTTAGTSGVLATPPNTFIPVRAGENMPAMSLVYFSGPDTVSLATSDPALINQRTPVGIVQEALATNEIGNLTQTGDVTYDQWDWSAYIGRPMYSNSAGQLVPTRPGGLMAYRVGYVKNANTIVFGVDAETEPQVYTASPNNVIVNTNSPLLSSDTINQIGERVVSISIPAATTTTPGYMTAAQAGLLAASTPRFTSAEGAINGLQSSKANVIHTHIPTDIIGLQSLLDGKMDANHLFDDRYSLIGHTHDGRYALVIHTHVIPDVTGLQDALNTKSDRFTSLISFARVFENVNLTGLNDASSGRSLTQVLADKAPLSHTHEIANVNGLGDELANRAFTNHTHGIAQVTGLQAALDSKQTAGETGAVQLSELTDVQLGYLPQAGSVLTFNGYAWGDRSVHDLLIEEYPDDVQPKLTVNDGAGAIYNVFKTVSFPGATLSQTGDELKIEVATDLSTLHLTSLSDVQMPYAAAAGDVLRWNGYKWWNAGLNLYELRDTVNAQNPNEGEVLTFLGNKWQPQPASTALRTLSDVFMPYSPTYDDLVIYNGSRWVAKNLNNLGLVRNMQDLVDVSYPSVNLGDVITWNGTNWTAEPVPVSTGGATKMDDLSDVSTIFYTPTAGDVLTWDGTTWRPETPVVDSGGSNVDRLDDLSDVTMGYLPQLGDVLTYNGYTWTNQQLPVIAGPQGEPGVAGPQGEPGIQGSVGPAGLQGEAGAPGNDGSIGSIGQQGEQGPVGPAGPVGPQGPQGIQGIQGSQGVPGAPGSQGLQGETGPAGSPGEAGAPGSQGPTGSVGPQGAQGSQGIQGLTGQAGNDASTTPIQNVIQVAKNGSDASGNGSIGFPYLSISSALTAANSLTGPVVINVAPGFYVEDVVLTRPCTTLRGYGTDNMTVIDGHITVTPASIVNGLPNSIFAFENMLLSNQTENLALFTFNGSIEASLRFRNIKVYSNASGAKGMVFTNTAPVKSRVYFENVDVLTKSIAVSLTNVSAYNRSFFQVESTQDQILFIESSSITLNQPVLVADNNFNGIQLNLNTTLTIYGGVVSVSDIGPMSSAVIINDPGAVLTAIGTTFSVPGGPGNAITGANDGTFNYANVVFTDNNVVSGNLNVVAYTTLVAIDG